MLRVCGMQVQLQLQEQVLDLLMQRQIEHESVDSVEKELAEVGLVVF